MGICLNLPSSKYDLNAGSILPDMVVCLPFDGLIGALIFALVFFVVSRRAIHFGLVMHA